MSIVLVGMGPSTAVVAAGLLVVIVLVVIVVVLLFFVVLALIFGVRDSRGVGRGISTP